MSLKSFDKFCENMILGPENHNYREKEIYDERQNQIRSKLIIEALLVFIGAVFINTIIMEECYRWCTSYLAPMALFGMVCYLYWMLRCQAKGCLFGIGSSYSTKWTAGVLIFESIVFGYITIDDAVNELEEGKSFFFNNGMVEGRFILCLVFPLLLTLGIITVILAKKHIKEVEGEEQEKSPKNSD